MSFCFVLVRFLVRYIIQIHLKIRRYNLQERKSTRLWAMPLWIRKKEKRRNQLEKQHSESIVLFRRPFFFFINILDHLGLIVKSSSSLLIKPVLAATLACTCTCTSATPPFFSLLSILLAAILITPLPLIHLILYSRIYFNLCAAQAVTYTSHTFQLSIRVVNFGASCLLLYRASS